jgi:hypothetical protein
VVVVVAEVVDAAVVVKAGSRAEGAVPKAKTAAAARLGGGDGYLLRRAVNPQELPL